MSHGVSLQHIHLELARTAEFPDGSAAHGYDLVAPLADDGRIDLAGWHEAKALCHVTRFWGGDEVRGRIVHTHRGWVFDFGDDAPQEPVFKLDRHAFLPGGYVSITERDGVQRPFRIVSVTPALGAA